MTNKFYGTRNYEDHSIYGGLIEQDDFNDIFPNQRRISNQVKAQNLRQISENKKKLKNEKQRYKNMTLEELREMNLISNTNGRPSSTLTDEKWQKEFNVRKLFITPYSKDVKKLRGKYSIESGAWDEDINGKYHGCSNWQQHCALINDMLKNIRSGQVDYCYYIYNIMELAKFHINDLETRYCDGYWEVWLKKYRYKYNK